MRPARPRLRPGARHAHRWHSRRPRRTGGCRPRRFQPGWSRSAGDRRAPPARLLRAWVILPVRCPRRHEAGRRSRRRWPISMRRQRRQARRRRRPRACAGRRRAGRVAQSRQVVPAAREVRLNAWREASVRGRRGSMAPPGQRLRRIKRFTDESIHESARLNQPGAKSLDRGAGAYLEGAFSGASLAGSGALAVSGFLRKSATVLAP